MCLSCGCNKPHEDHGDNRHIVMKDLEEAASAESSSVGDVVRNIQQAFEKAENAGQAMGGGNR